MKKLAHNSKEFGYLMSASVFLTVTTNKMFMADDFVENGEEITTLVKLDVSGDDGKLVNVLNDVDWNAITGGDIVMFALAIRTILGKEGKKQ